MIATWLQVAELTNELHDAHEVHRDLTHELMGARDKLQRTEIANDNLTHIYERESVHMCACVCLYVRESICVCARVYVCMCVFVFVGL